MAAHIRTAVHCRLGRLLDSNPGLQFYNLVSLPMSHHCSLKPPLLEKLTLSAVDDLIFYKVNEKII
jgi:hypothetical protein